MPSLLKSVVSRTKFMEPFRRSALRSLEEAADVRHSEDSAPANTTKNSCWIEVGGDNDRLLQPVHLCNVWLSLLRQRNEQSHCCFHNWHFLLGSLLCSLIPANPHWSDIILLLFLEYFAHMCLITYVCGCVYKGVYKQWAVNIIQPRKSSSTILYKRIMPNLHHQVKFQRLNLTLYFFQRTHCCVLNKIFPALKMWECRTFYFLKVNLNATGLFRGYGRCVTPHLKEFHLFFFFPSKRTEWKVQKNVTFNIKKEGKGKRKAFHQLPAWLRIYTDVELRCILQCCQLDSIKNNHPLHFFLFFCT